MHTILKALAATLLVTVTGCTAAQRAARDVAERAAAPADSVDLPVLDPPTATSTVLPEGGPTYWADVTCLTIRFHGTGWVPGTWFNLAFGSQPPAAAYADADGVLDYLMVRPAGMAETTGQLSYWGIDEATVGLHDSFPITCDSAGVLIAG